MQVSNKQMDRVHTLVANERQTKKRSGQWGMSNLFRKNSKTSAFFTKLAEKKFWVKLLQRAAELNGFPSISAKMLGFPSLPQTGLKNKPFAV